jgi:hypothetical protein
MKSSKTTKTFLSLAALLSIILCSGFAAPVTIYSDVNYGGAAQELGVGDTDVGGLTIGNDNVSSLKIAPGYQVTLYEHGGFSGASLVLKGDYGDLRYANFNDYTSSIRVEVTEVPVAVYADGDFNGNAQAFWGVGNYDVSALAVVGNDAMSAIRVRPGYKVTLYEHSGFSGASTVVTTDIPNLTSLGFNDRVSSMRIESISPLDSTSVQVSAFDDFFKASMLNRYAPRIWMASGEIYWASSVDWALTYLQRYLSARDNTYCYKTVQTMSSPTTKLPYFSGNQGTALIYSFWVEKDFFNIDLSYWMFCPYNYGKVVLGQEFGDHVSDWEHVTIRLTRFAYNGVTYVKPVLVNYPYHSSQLTYSWANVTKVSGTDHVIAYSAKNSHGMWRDAGSHVYQNIVIAQLTDDTSAGTQWDTWNTLKTYEWFARGWWGRGLNGMTYPSYFTDNYINRWGNETQGSAFGQPILADGPRGPEGHGTLWDPVGLW